MFYHSNSNVMQTLLIISIYLIGYITSYLLLRYELKKEFNGSWTKSDRAFALKLSLVSWINVGVSLFNLIGENFTKSGDEEANW